MNSQRGTKIVSSDKKYHIRNIIFGGSKSGMKWKVKRVI